MTKKKDNGKGIIRVIKNQERIIPVNLFFNDAKWEEFKRLSREKYRRSMREQLAYLIETWIDNEHEKERREKEKQAQGV